MEFHLQRGVAAWQAVEGLLGVHQGGDRVILKVIFSEATPRIFLMTHDLDIVAKDLSAKDFEHSCHESEEKMRVLLLSFVVNFVTLDKWLTCSRPDRLLKV